MPPTAAAGFDEMRRASDSLMTTVSPAPGRSSSAVNPRPASGPIPSIGSRPWVTRNPATRTGSPVPGVRLTCAAIMADSDSTVELRC